MFNYIKETYKKGDKLKLSCAHGEFCGEIVFISDDSIILKTQEGKVCGIKGRDISFFEELSDTIPQSKHEKENPNDAIPKSEEKETLSINKTVQKNVEATEGEDGKTEKNEKAGKGSFPNQQSTNIKDNKTPSYKPGDRIPLDELHRIDPSTKKVKERKDKKDIQTFNSFEDLTILVADEHKKQNEKIVPAQGIIKIDGVFPERNFGFIKDSKSGKDLYFSFLQIVDKDITKTPSYLRGLPVVYTIQENYMGLTAVSIHKPRKVSEIITIAEELLKNNDTKHARDVINHILNEYPENFTADKIMRSIGKKYKQAKVMTNAMLFNKAKDYSLAKDYPNAIEYYKKAIKAGVKIESAIKDLGSLYAQLYKQGSENASDYRDQAIILMKERKDILPHNTSNLYYLENLYYSIEDYQSFISIAEELLEKKEICDSKSRRTPLLCKIAVAYVKIGKRDTALQTIDEILLYDQTNINAINLKNAIEANQDIDAIDPTGFETLISGLSPFIQRTLDEYDEYAGVPAKAKESGEFDDAALRRVRVIIDQVSGRSKDRAPFLLTEAKLMQIIEPDSTVQLRTVLARYCNDMAKNHIADNSPLDVVRFYYNEAFSLEDNYRNNAQNVAYFMLTHVYDYRKLLSVLSNNVTIESALKETFTSNLEASRYNNMWINILTMFLYNKAITASLTSIFFSNRNYRTMAVKALNEINIPIKEDCNRDEFSKAWDKARETLKQYNSKIEASIKAIASTQTLEDMFQQLSQLRELPRQWMCPLDITRLNTIDNNIKPALKSYIECSGYRNKETYKNNANGQISQLIEEIMKRPTKLSYEELIPLLNTMESLLTSSFQEVVRMSAPRIKIKLLSEETVINDDGTVRIQVEVSNHKDSSPIKEVSVSIEESNDLKTIKDGDKNIRYNAIEGGESDIFKLQFKVSDEVKRQKATAINVTCNYKNGNEQKNISEQLSLKLYAQNEFKRIDNPYAPVADGGPLPEDSKMFFGRELEISNIVDSIIYSPSKQIIIYGQKRSGKSSVMVRLKRSLMDTGKTFCIFFSLGDIINNLTETAFYHKILRSIADELEFLKMDGENNVPDFEIPAVQAFKEEDPDNPLNTFTKYMIKFKLSCKQTEGWQDKKLVVMIDEFTYLYSAIKKGEISPSIMKQWKAITQNERAQFSVILVGQDVVPSFKNEDYARNAFGVIQDIRLTYLKEDAARNLIEKPILDENGNSRYIGEAVSRIIEYTSRNPYYIQIFCSRLVDFMNENKSISVTEADVNEVARSFIDGSEALAEDKFDNLIRAGESEDLQEYSESDILAILRQISINSKNIGYCGRSAIDALGDTEKENAILKDLCDREVLEKKGSDNYKIQVKLFQEWLLNH